MNCKLGDLRVLLAADGSQIELRALAEISGDPLLIKQFKLAAEDRRNPLKDIHCQVGHMLMGWPVERIASDKNARRVCKNLHFGIIFGKAEAGIYDYIVAKIRQVDGRKADLSGITEAGSRRLYRKYFQTYKGVARYVARQQALVEERGFVETLFGFRREIRKEDETRDTFWGNQAVNSPVQGTAHQFLLIALALLHLKPRTYGLLQKCIMEVHDALYFLVKLRDLPEAYKQVMDLFEDGAWNYAKRRFGLRLQVPLLAEASAGFTMASMPDYRGEKVDEFLEAWRKKHREVEAKTWESFAGLE